VKVGDVVLYKWGMKGHAKHPNTIGTVLEFPTASHPKEFQKVKVITEQGLIEDWIMQYCEVISENQ
jgi:hypothetical protein|tara:strand:- start:1160 stop:1357 length:198 start_codon:yes stop_codon:yes gene_type:complete